MLSIHCIPTPDTIANGAQVQCSGELTFPVIQRLVDEVVTVSDRQLIDTMSFLATRMKMLVEPSGCLATAAVLHSKVSVTSERVVIVLSSGNIDPARFASLMTREAAEAA